MLAAVVAASLFLNCVSSSVLLISVAVSGCPLAGQFCSVLKVIPGGYFSSPSSNFIDTDSFRSSLEATSPALLVIS